MVEDVEKLQQGAVFGANSAGDQLGHVIGKRAQRADQAHEIDGHRRAGAFPFGQRMNGTGGEMQDGVGSEAHHFRLRMAVASHRHAVRLQPPEHAHRLKEVERIGLPEEQFADFLKRYIRIFCPARGGHCFKTLFRCRVRTTS